jgi:HEAT repeat protein
MGQLAKSEQSAELRMEAVEKLGLMGDATTPQLKSLYADSSDAGVRRAVLKAFFLQGNAKALVEVARGEKDPALKKQAVKHLSVMGSKEATDFMLEILNQ